MYSSYIFRTLSVLPLAGVFQVCSSNRQSSHSLVGGVPQRKCRSPCREQPRKTLVQLNNHYILKYLPACYTFLACTEDSLLAHCLVGIFQYYSQYIVLVYYLRYSSNVQFHSLYNFLFLQGVGAFLVYMEGSLLGQYPVGISQDYIRHMS